MGVKRYRAYARETLRVAELAAKPEVRATFANLSARWTSLAREVEQSAHRDAGRLTRRCRGQRKIRPRGLRAIKTPARVGYLCDLAFAGVAKW